MAEMAELAEEERIVGEDSMKGKKARMGKGDGSTHTLAVEKIPKRLLNDFRVVGGLLHVYNTTHAPTIWSIPGGSVHCN